MPKQLTATVSDEADLACYTIEVALRNETGVPVRRPEVVEIALLVAAEHIDECLAHRKAFLAAARRELVDGGVPQEQ